MIEFLEEYYRQTQSSEVMEILLELRYGAVDADGAPVSSDAGSWADWIGAVARTRDAGDKE
jgi:hypothetical protein